jgi:hypothetical protein
MKTIVLMFALAAPCAFAAGGGSPEADTDPKVSQFSVSGVSAVQALLQLSRDEHLPMGIVEDDGTLCKSTVSYSAQNAPASTVIEGITAQVPGYAWKRSQDSTVFLISPVSTRSVTTQFLQLVDHSFRPTKDTLQGLEMTLWAHIRYILYPDKGTAGSILSSTHPRVYELEVRDASVQQILDQMAVLAKGAWILRPLPPTLASLPGLAPFSIFTDDGRRGMTSGDLCTPVGEAGHE